MIYFMVHPFWQVGVKLESYSYYPPRGDFISRDSRFDTWVLVASERGEFAWETVSASGAALSGEAGFGDLVCAAPGVPFFRRVLSPALTYHVLQWSFVDARGRPVEVSWQPGRAPIRDTARLASTFGALKGLYLRGDAWSVRRQAHLLEELLHLAWQTQAEPGAATDPLMAEAARLLRQRAGEAFAMREVSAACGLGPVQFTRRFRAAHGTNPIEYVTALRLEIARRLLIETALSLDEIASRCGWSSGAYLSHVFTRQLLTTPGKFRVSRRV